MAAVGREAEHALACKNACVDYRASFNYMFLCSKQIVRELPFLNHCGPVSVFIREAKDETAGRLQVDFNLKDLPSLTP